MNPSIGGSKPYPPWLRALALLGLLALPAAWLGSLAIISGYWVTNLARVAGALAAAGLFWKTKGGGRGSPWGSLVMAGIGGSLVVTGLSMLLPALGTWTAAGWLMSGAVGGAMIGLGLLAMGGADATPTAG
jgi:hypothetical protein